MTACLDFFVPGVPEPEGSTRAFVVGGRAVVTHTKGSALNAWRATVRLTAISAARTHRWALEHDGPVTVTAAFTMPAPKRPRFQSPAVKPDLDKLARAVGDAITTSRAHGPGLIREDSRIVTWHVSKEYGTRPGVHVTITKEEP